MPDLWLPGRPLLDSAEADALDTLTPPPAPETDPWALDDPTEAAA